MRGQGAQRMKRLAPQSRVPAPLSLLPPPPPPHPPARPPPTGGVGYGDPAFVEYDADTEDIAWLQQFNGDQVGMGVGCGG